jgi:ABC-2 type transport system permease protein
VRNIILIAEKELRSLLSSVTVYVVAAVFLLLSGVSFSMYLAGTAYSDTSIRGFVDAAKLLVLLFAAVLTMRLIAEERKLGTWELLLTAPIRDGEIVLGKFAGSLATLMLMLVPTLYYPLLLIYFGDPDFGPMATSYLGLLLLAAAALAVGIFASSLSSNQLIAAVLAGGILFALWFLGAASTLLPEAPGRFLAYLSPAYHFPDFMRGIIDTRALVFFVSLTALFLYLATRLVEADRWR